MASFASYKILLFLFISRSLAFQFFTPTTLPAEPLAPACITALTADIACPRQLKAFTQGGYFPINALEEACTTTCATALALYQSSVSAACTGLTYDISETRTAPIDFIPTLLYYAYNRTCITDAGRWCNYIAFQAAGSTSPGSLPPSKRQAVDPCDNCLIKQLQFQAGSPINGGVALQPSYSSFTSSCSKTGFPLATSDPPFNQPQPSAPPPPTPTCGGTTYTIQSGNTCRSISQSEGIGTGWLLFDNGLQAYCANFPTTGELCIQSTCTTYQVQINDTCASIAAAEGLSAVQIGLWNPVLGRSCRAIASSVGDYICLSPPGVATGPTSSVTVPTSTAAPTDVPAPVPTDIAQGTTEHCSRYYQVQPGEFCNMLLVRFYITMDDFMFLNQGVNENCTNLFAFESYCVRPVGRIDSYPGHPGYIPPESAYPTIPFAALPKATYTAPPVSVAPLAPLASGTRSDCYLFADSSELNIDFALADTFYNSICEVLVAAWDITLEQLGNWNPSLTTNSSACSPAAGYRYCMQAYDGSLVTATEPTPTSSPELPIRAGATEDCFEYSGFQAPDTCARFLYRHNITVAQFYEWNPAVGAECTNIWFDYRYCIRVDPIPDEPEEPVSSSAPPVPSSTSSAPPTSTSGAPPPPGPTQPGTVANCNAWHLVQAGDGCWSVATQYGITLQQFYDWNPFITNDCANGFWGGYAYCVGVSS